MPKEKRGSAGGKKQAIILRKEAIDKYYKNPKICLYCGKVIEVGENQKVADIKRKKFCNQSCNARFSARNRSLKSSLGFCEKCNTPIHYKPSKNGGYYRRKYCENCLSEVRAKNTSKKQKDKKYKNIKHTYKKDSILKITSNTTDVNFIGNLTKEQVFSRSKNWTSARSAISRHARKVYVHSGKPYACYKCGYDYYTDVCHMLSVADFPNSALISEINNIDNLIRLCKNHHKEKDDGILNF